MGRWLLIGVLLLLTGCKSGSPPDNEDTFRHRPVALILEKEISGSILSAMLDKPSGLAVNRLNQWYLSDASRNRIIKFNQENEPERAYGSYGIGIGQFSCPSDILIDRGLNVLVLDTDNRRVVQLDFNLNYVGEITPENAEDEIISNRGTLAGLEVSSLGEVTVADFDNSRLIRLDNFYRFSRYIGDFGYGRGALLNPMGLVYSDNKLFVADAGNGRIAVYDDYGNYQFSFGEEYLEYPAAVSVAPDGLVWVADQELDRIFVFSPGGRLIYEFGSSGNDDNRFNNIEALAISAQNMLYVADSGNHRVLIYRIIYEDV